MCASDAHNGPKLEGCLVHGTFPRGAEANPAGWRLYSTVVRAENLKAKTNGQNVMKLGCSRGHEDMVGIGQHWRA